MELIVCKEKVSIPYKIYYSYIKIFKFVKNIKIFRIYKMCTTLFVQCHFEERKYAQFNVQDIC